MTYPEKFDTSTLDSDQKLILTGFFQRRKIFDSFLNGNKVSLHTCPSCGYPTLTERSSYQICDVCNWEDDSQDDENADEIWGGPNYELSLTENRLNIGKQLQDIATQTGGTINTNAALVLKILFGHDKKIENLLKTIPDDANTNHPIFEQYKQAGQTLLQQLVTT